MALVFVGALVAEALARMPGPLRGPALVLALTVACTANVLVAKRQQAFRLWDYESRYRTVGHYLKETLPPNAVVITFQESGSIHYYTGVPISRWDFMPQDLDDSVSAFRQRGLHRFWSWRIWYSQLMHGSKSLSPLYGPRATRQTTRV